MSLSDRAKLELLLSSCGVARNDEVEVSIGIPFRGLEIEDSYQ